MLARALLAVVFPLVMFLGGVRLMFIVAGVSGPEGKPLYQRWGYSRHEVVEQWSGLADLDAERRLLQVDLLYPLVYGGALGLSLLALWAMLGRRFHPAWLLLPVVVSMIADWTENAIQLRQLDRFAAGREAAAVDAGAIAIASGATIVKLSALALLVGLLVLLFVLVLVRARSTLA